MGGGGSQTIEQTFNLSTLNESIFNQITTNQQSLTATVDNAQTIEIQAENIGEKCNLIIGQTIDSSSQSSTVMSPETIAATKDTVENELRASAEAALEKQTEMGNFQFGDEQDMKQEINQEVKNIIEKTFETENINTIVSSMINVQDGKLIIKNCNGKVDFQQNIVAKLAAEAITNSLTTAISENDTLSSLAGDAGASGKTENKGLADFLSALSGPLLYAIIGCVLCVCVVVIALLVFSFTPAGQKSATKLVNARTARMPFGGMPIGGMSVQTIPFSMGR